VVEANSNYRLKYASNGYSVVLHNKTKIAWSIKVATLGWGGFVDALIAVKSTRPISVIPVPYQRRR